MRGSAGSRGGRCSQRVRKDRTGRPAGGEEQGVPEGTGASDRGDESQPTAAPGSSSSSERDKGRNVYSRLAGSPQKIKDEVLKEAELAAV